MVSRPSGFHVRHDLQPHLAQELLMLLKAAGVPQTEGQLKQAAHRRAYHLRDRKSYSKLLRSLFELGLLKEYKGSIELSELGWKISNIGTYYPHMLPEFVHFLYYTLWDKDQNNRFSWSYRTVCHWLWDASPCVIDRDRLVNLVIQKAYQEFRLKGISFSQSSVSGILNWVTELNPACISRREGQQIFAQRPYCTVELFILALDKVHTRLRTNSISYVSLSPEVREAVCRICLVSLDAFDDMLAQTEAIFASLQVRRERGERFALHDFAWDNLEE
jgi:hypothetical protein